MARFYGSRGLGSVKPLLAIPFPPAPVQSMQSPVADRVLNPSGLETVAVVDYEFHRRTASSDFFLEALASRFRVACFYDRRPVGRFRRIICWQVAPSFVPDERVVWVPMWDEFHDHPQLPSNTLRVVSFSQELHQRIASMGAQSRHYQMWPAPAPPSSASHPVVFFWKRTTAVSWADVKTMIRRLPDVSVHYRHVPDPGQEPDLPSVADQRQYRMTIHGWSAREAHLDLLRSSSIFVAPRLREGIGMSLLDAMARALCVVARDESTAREYITNGETGILFKDPGSVDLSSYEALGRAAHARVAQGHQQWTESIPDLIDYVLA